MLGRSIAASAALVLGLTPTGAIATPQDVASTHAYIVANYAFVKASDAKVGPAQADILRLNRRLGYECPHAGAGSPENSESQKPSYEVAGALWSVSYGADAGPIRAFVRAVRPLRWSDRAITRIMQRYTSSLTELAALPLPHLCADVRAWSASGFTTIPTSTITFDQHVESIEGHSIPTRLLAPYELPGDRSILKRTTQLETKLEQIETVVGFNDWDLVLETLGLNQ